MARSYGRKSRGGGYGRGVQVDPATALHDLTTKLFDKADGHGADWAAAAEASFRVAFSCLRNLPADSRELASIARRAHDAAYSLMAGTDDSGAPYKVAGSQPARPAFTMTDPAPDHDPSR